MSFPQVVYSIAPRSVVLSEGMELSAKGVQRTVWPSSAVGERKNEPARTAAEGAAAGSMAREVPESMATPGAAGAKGSGQVAGAPVRMEGVRRMWSRDSFFYAMGNETRRRMFYLIAREPAGFSIEQMAGRVREKRSVTGKHLRILRMSEAVVVVRRGRESVHVLHPALRAQVEAPEWLDLGFMRLQVPVV